MFQRWHVNYKLFVIGGWSKISFRNETFYGTCTLLLIMKIMFSAFIHCYLSLGIILMILMTYSTLVSSLLGPMTKDSTNFANLKPSSGTRSNDTEVNAHVMSPGCDIWIEMLLISCGDIEMNPGPTFTCLLKKWTNNEAN